MANRISSDDENLFGESSEDEDQVPIPTTATDSNQPVENDDLFGTDNEEEETKEIVLEDQIVDFSAHKNNSDLFLLKLPKFLAIESQPFDPEKYQYKEFLQSAIRWRYKESIQESNSRLIRWNNGTFSLLVGDEMFDVKTPDIHSRYQFLATQHAKEQAVKTQARFNKFMSFTHQSTDTEAHKKWMFKIGKTHQKVAKSKQYIVLQDPEQEMREAERNERIKARRKLEAKRLASLRNEMEESSRYSRNDRMMDLYDHDIEDEAFNENYSEDESEEEEIDDEERAERLLNAKKVQKDEQEIRSKRLRIIEDSDDD